MNYTIAILQDVHNDVKINIDKNGNKYTVGIYNEITKEYTHKSFNEMQEAYKVFENLSKSVVSGCYSYEQRKAFLIEA